MKNQFSDVKIKIFVDIGHCKQKTIKTIKGVLRMHFKLPIYWLEV